MVTIMTVIIYGVMVTIMIVIIYAVDVVQDHSSSHDSREPAGRESTETPGKKFS